MNPPEIQPDQINVQSQNPQTNPLEQAVSQTVDPSVSKN